jgi:hypothetical protein
MVFNFDNTLMAAEWNQVMHNISNTQLYFHHRQTAKLNGIVKTPGEYYWVEGGDTSSQQYWYSNFQQSKIMGAYPGFRDYYIEGGYGFSLPFMFDVNINTLEQRMNFVKRNNPEYVQIITFNDYGEGTMMEPTVEFGFSFLHALQKFAGVTYGIAELELIYKYYKLRSDSERYSIPSNALQSIYHNLVQLKTIPAKNIIDRYYF